MEGAIEVRRAIDQDEFGHDRFSTDRPRQGVRAGAGAAATPRVVLGSGAGRIGPVAGPSGEPGDIEASDVAGPPGLTGSAAGVCERAPAALDAGGAADALDAGGAADALDAGGAADALDAGGGVGVAGEPGASFGCRCA